ncbi:MAG: hypothetical protein LLG00_02270 [Planctomycetaceae bacterium]|nr:hypothetical protein [Planctomycetaceae bacterium]
MDFKRTLLYACGLALAMGGPISLFSASDFAGKLRSNPSGPPPKTAPAPQPVAKTQAPAPTPTPPPEPASAPSAPAGPPLLANMPTPSLAEVLSFDATVEWVMQRWPRVSTGMPYLQLQGYRVPLVSGTSLRDVAGSLTYYFNATQRVERITLRGTTGDPSELVAILANQHHFTRRLTNDPGVVLYEAVDSGGQLVGTLKIRSAKVVKADQPYSRFEVDLVMDRAA